MCSQKRYKLSIYLATLSSEGVFGVLITNSSGIHRTNVSREELPGINVWALVGGIGCWLPFLDVTVMLLKATPLSSGDWSKYSVLLSLGAAPGIQPVIYPWRRALSFPHHFSPKSRHVSVSSLSPCHLPQWHNSRGQLKTRLVSWTGFYF